MVFDHITLSGAPIKPLSQLSLRGDTSEKSTNLYGARKKYQGCRPIGGPVERKCSCTFFFWCSQTDEVFGFGSVSVADVLLLASSGLDLSDRWSGLTNGPVQVCSGQARLSPPTLTLVLGL